ncbi:MULTISPECIES: metal ABC transporter substrate-binding protein [unclassified Luteococcus]|uniref:metal ABC transporter substrate-binding protein n=1 Tax=unclassified Luteococcus TaxID=2639923 RepID=UPI00313D05E9
MKTTNPSTGPGTGARRRRVVVPAVASLLLAASACGAPPQAGDDQQLTVVTAFYPLQYVAENVAGDRARVTTLTAPGSEPHDLELTIRQVAALSGADLVIYQKGFQPSVDKAVEQAQPKRVLDVSSVVPAAASTDEGEHTGEHAHEHDEHGDEHEGGHEGETAAEHAAHAGHDHGTTDPHLWLDPKNMARISQAVERSLAEADPAGAAAYTASAQQLGGRLTALDRSFATGLKNCRRKEFITSHAAFGYLAKAYGLHQIGISGLAAESDPSPARIAEVQRLAREHGVTTIFYETLVSPSHAQAIAGDLKLRTDVLDPLEGITDESRGSDYISVQQANLAALQTANGCQ